MANQSITTTFALHNHQFVVAEGEHRSLDWEVVEVEDLYADVDSLDSFSMSSGDEDDVQEQESEEFSPIKIHVQFDDCNMAVHVMGQDLEVIRLELQRNPGFDFGDGAFNSADYDTDDVEFEVDVVGEPNRGMVPVVDPLGFHIERFVVPNHDQGFLDQSMDKEDNIDVHDDEDDDDDDDDDENEYESNVDDELVPWGVADRLEKQRMRKLGKRTCSRMNKSKKMAHYYTKSACLHGKHGLGLKAY